MPTVCDYVCLWGWTGRELHAVKSTRLTHNGLWASISEQRVVRRLGFLLTDPYQFDILQSSPACGRPNAAQSIETARFHRAVRQRGATSINIPAEPKPSGVVVKGRRHGCRPTRSVWNGLLVRTDAAPQIAGLGYDAHLRNRRLVGAWPRKHVADLADLSFRLLRRGVEFRAIHVAGGVLEGPDIGPQKLLCIVAGNGKDLAVADVEAEWIDVAIEESGFTLVDQVERFGLIRFHSGDCFV